MSRNPEKNHQAVLLRKKKGIAYLTLNRPEVLKTINKEMLERLAARRPGSGGTVWDMAARFQVNTSSVSWEMLDTVRHNPLVIVRKAHQKSVINVGD